MEDKNDGDERDEDVPVFSEREQEELQKQGAIKISKGEWRMPDGRQVLNRALTRKVLEIYRTQLIGELKLSVTIS